MLIRELTQQDWPLVKEIYLAGLATGNASFETQAPEWADAFMAGWQK